MYSSHLEQHQMDSAAEVSCDVCDELADVVQNEHIDSEGKRLQWPMVSVKPDSITSRSNVPTVASVTR